MKNFLIVFIFLSFIAAFSLAPTWVLWLIKIFLVIMLIGALPTVFSWLMEHVPLFKKLIQKLFKKQTENYELLEKVLFDSAKEIERMSFEELNAENSREISKEFNGRSFLVSIRVDIEDYKTGDIAVDVGINSKDYPTFGITPGYYFCKKKDGTVYNQSLD